MNILWWFDDDYDKFNHYHETCESAPVIDESCSAAACSILKMINMMIMTMLMIMIIIMTMVRMKLMIMIQDQADVDDDEYDDTDDYKRMI